MDRQVTLTVREQARLKVITEMDAGRVKAKEGAAVMRVSVRHAKRLLAGYREQGAAALAHGNRGRPSPRRIPEEVSERIIELARTTYADYNDTHFTEKLAEKHDIRVCRSTVRRLRRSIGQGSPRKRRAPRHRSRRDPYPQPGMLLQIDGSPHDWLEGRGPYLTLITAIDDATNELPCALFRDQEDAAGYFLLMRAITQSHGIPQAVYTDRHTIFRSPKKLSIQQQLAGEQPRSQFGRLMDELGIEPIPSYSPQARGRVERLFGTLQDRLVKELREANASTVEDANRVLTSYIPQHNTRFSRPQAEPGSAYHPWPAELDPDDLFCFKHQRTVNNDNTISFSGHLLQIPPGPDRISYARAHVEVHQHLDGSLAICHKGNTLVVYQPATSAPVRIGKFTPAAPLPKPEPPPLAQPPKPKPKPKPRQPYKPPPDHPWRRYPISLKRGR
jgi:transposase